MRRLLAALLLGAALTRAAAAQAPPAVAPSGDAARTPPIVRYGKWGAAALFVGFTALGVIQHREANDAYDNLRDYCRTGSCSIGFDGHYANPVAEARYQEVVHADRAARAWLVSGQVALAGATALFIVELLNARGTRNIPFQGLTITPGRSATRIGWKLPI